MSYVCYRWFLEFCVMKVAHFLQKGKKNKTRRLLSPRLTDKRTDVWSRDFIIWKINFGLWAVAWAGLWNKRVWADYEQLFWAFFSIFHGEKKIILAMKNWKNRQIKLLVIGPDPFIPQPKIDFPYYEISGPDICSLICNFSASIHLFVFEIAFWNVWYFATKIVLTYCEKKLF